MLRFDGFFKVYALVDPVSFQPVYVGCTYYSLSFRLSNHLRQRSNAKKNMWIASLSAPPLIVLIKRYKSEDKAKRMELYCIRKLSKNFDLFNIHLGKKAKRIKKRKAICRMPRPKKINGFYCFD